MIFQGLDQIVFDSDTSLKETIACLNKTAVLTDGKGFGIIIDKDGIALGVISDGDIRRNLVEGISLDEPISKVMKIEFISVSEKHTAHQILKLFDQKISNIPLINEDGKPIDLYSYSQFRAPAYSKPRIIRNRVPARISFSGGGTDMSHYFKKESSFVLSTTINRYCTASILPRKDNSIHIISKDLEQECMSSSCDNLTYDGNLDLLKAAVKVMQPDFGFNLETFSELDPGTGLGGSSAITVAVIGALNEFRNENQLDSYQIADLAYQAERVELGIVGGWQDQYSTTFGGFNLVEFRENEVIVNPLRIQRQTLLELEYNLMFFRIGGHHNSGNIQKEMIHKSNKLESTPFSKSMNDLTITMKESLLKGKLNTFGKLLNIAWEIKKKMNQDVSSPLVDQCYEEAIKLGALGGKLLGAGRSGYILFYSSPLYQKAIQKRLEKLGCGLEQIRFTDSGLESWSTIL